ncbi:MAG: hypothetical protein Q7J67_04915 [bacterium]|nr:hypothetical protein [bacterium]
MKIALVHASITSCGFNSFGKGDLTESTWISHGLCSIAAFANSKGFSNVELIDLRRLKNWQDFTQKIMNKNPDVVGITMMSVDFNPVMRSGVSPKNLFISDCKIEG